MPPGYYWLPVTGKLWRNTYARYKSLLKKRKFDLKKPDLSGLIPLYSIRILDEQKQHVGFAKSSLNLEEDGGFFYIAGDDEIPHERVTEFVTLAGLDELFEGESIILD